MINCEEHLARITLLFSSFYFTSNKSHIQTLVMRCNPIKAPCFLSFLLTDQLFHFVFLFVCLFVMKALTKYQMLFRHLFYARHVERQLCK